MMSAWTRIGLRGRLALSIAAIVIAAFAVVFVAVRREMADERGVITREEGREAGSSAPPRFGDLDTSSHVAPIGDAQSEVEKTFLIAGGLSLAAALIAAYLVAARTAAPLRRMATTASAVDAGDLSPRIASSARAPIEIRTLAVAFDHMLDRLDEAFSRQRRFVSDASHELRTPLTAIRGQLELLAREESPDPAEVRRVEAVALKEMDRIERLVEELLVLARLDEGEPLRRQPIAIGPFLHRIAEEEPAGGVTVGAVPEGSLRADPDRLTQVVRNLLGNARRHAGPEGEVEISAEARDELLRIVVDDDGPGIPSAERELVFDRFHRSEASRDRQTGGSGLGLAIARSIVELHGGRIWVAASPLGGARLVFELGPFERQLGTA
jgi:signal transduction histidine kinase